MLKDYSGFSGFQDIWARIIGATTSRPRHLAPTPSDGDGEHHEEERKFDACVPIENIACRQYRRSHVVQTTLDCAWVQAAETGPVC